MRRRTAAATWTVAWSRCELPRARTAAGAGPPRAVPVGADRDGRGDAGAPRRLRRRGRARRRRARGRPGHAARPGDDRRGHRGDRDPLPAGCRGGGTGGCRPTSCATRGRRSTRCGAARRRRRSARAARRTRRGWPPRWSGGCGRPRRTRGCSPRCGGWRGRRAVRCRSVARRGRAWASASCAAASPRRSGTARRRSRAWRASAAHSRCCAPAPRRPRPPTTPGYADQAHLTRELRALGGRTPAALRNAPADAPRPTRVIVQKGLCATSHGWPSGSTKTPE